MIRFLVFILLCSIPSYASAYNDEDDLFSNYESESYDGHVDISYISSGIDYVEYRNCGSITPFLIVKYNDMYRVTHNEYPAYRYTMDYIYVEGDVGSSIKVLQFCYAKDRQDY